MMRRLFLLLPAVLLLTGCAAPPRTSGQWDALFAQELLFLQQGLRQHGVEGTCTVYFAPPETCPDLFAQDLLIEGTEGLWWERLTGTYDKERDWYTFTGSFEPILLPETVRGEYAETDREEKEAFRDAATARAELSADMDLPTPLRFDVPPGPVTYCQRQEEMDWGSAIETYTYLYQDLRLDFSAEIRCPRFAALPRAEEVDRRLEEALFYGCPDGRNSAWSPAELWYGQVQRTFEITRWDGRYLSLCVYEYNDFRQANRPNEWYTGLTIDTETGDVLTPADVLGPDWPIEDCGAGPFHSLPPWDMDGEEMLAALRTAVERNASDRFYLTDSTIVFIDNSARQSRRLEAPLPALGLDRWLPFQTADE